MIGLISQRRRLRQGGMNKIIAINFIPSGGSIITEQWNNLILSGTKQSGPFNYTDGEVSSVSIADYSFGQASNDPIENQIFPRPEIYLTDWYASGSIENIKFVGLDPTKTYVFKVIGRLDTSMGWTLNSDGSNPVIQTGYPTSTDLLDNTGYAVLPPVTGETEITIYGVKMSGHWTSILALVIIET